MLTGGPRLTVRRRERRGWMVALSLGLHLAALLLALVVVRLPALPTEPPAVEIIAEPGPATAEKPATPSEALPAAAVPAEAVPAEAVPPPPPPPDTQAQVPPPPPPPDQTEIAAAEPPPPPPPPPAQVVRPPPPPRRVAAPPPRRSSPRTETVEEHGAASPGPQAANAAAPSTERPDDSLRVEGASLPADWIRQIQAYWDLHAYYPKEAVEKNVSGTVKVHLLIHSNGDVFLVKVVEASGFRVLDDAGFYVFHNAHLRPFPPGTNAPEADVTISLHYVLMHGTVVAAAHAPALRKPPFTVTEEPVKGTVVAIMQQQVCTGIAVQGGTGRPGSWIGMRSRVTATFVRKPDGTSWVNWWDEGGTSSVQPVTELGVSAQWSVPWVNVSAMFRGMTHYAVWPAGGGHLSGSVIESKEGGQGSIDLTCHSEPAGPKEPAEQPQ